MSKIAIGILLLTTPCAIHAISFLGSGGLGTTNVSFTSQRNITVTHNFGKYPLIQVLNSSGQLIAPALITHVSANQILINLTTTSNGTVVLSQ